MEVVAVRVELPGNSPIVVLRELDGDERLLPIFIGQPEATAIAFALDGVVTPRPMTHDLMIDVLATGSGEHRVSSRPSDALALALRSDCPIFAAEAVLDIAGVIADEADDDSEEGGEDVVEQFREFIANINPEDFNPEG